MFVFANRFSSLPFTFLDKADFEEEDLIVFEKLPGGNFNLKTIKSDDPRYTDYISKLNTNNYIITDDIPGNVIKPKTSVNGELLFEPKPGIFKKVSDLARTV